MNKKKLRGDWGEALVAGDLRRRGYDIVASQFRCRMGEVDLIARKHGVLCFVEVKLRRTDAFGSAGAFVDRRKQEKLRATAQLYLAEHPTGLQPRFDVAEIYAPQGMATRAPRVRLLENAF